MDGLLCTTTKKNALFLLSASFTGCRGSGDGDGTSGGPLSWLPECCSHRHLQISAHFHQSKKIEREKSKTNSYYSTGRSDVTDELKMDLLQSRELGFSGKEILFRKIEFERYRKPQVVEYPRNAMVLNPQHARQTRETSRKNDTQEEPQSDGDADAEGNGSESGNDDDDDPRRIDKDSLLCPDAQLRRLLRLQWQRIGPASVGLVNLGNTCFANSVLQSLAHTPAIAQYFMDAFRSADTQLGAPFDFAFALAETIRQMRRENLRNGNGASGGQAAYRPSLIIGNLRLLSKHFSLGRQCDAHEFAVQLLFGCEKSILHRIVGSKKVPLRVANTTALYRICGGYLRSRVTWKRQDEIQQLMQAGKRQAALDLKMEAKQQSNGHISAAVSRREDDWMYSNTYDPFTLLTVDLAGHQLQHCLSKFFAPETLEGRCYCTPRDVAVHAKKQFSLHVAPPVLIIHLKRFDAAGRKVNKHIEFPLELDVAPFCSSSSSSSGQATGSGDGDEAVKRGTRGTRYQLNALCIHEGRSIHYGHYYAIARESNGAWYEYNDSQVRRLSEDEALRSQAYILFYSRIPTDEGRRSTTPQPNGATSRVAPTSPLSRRSTLLARAPVSPDETAVGTALSEEEVAALLKAKKSSSPPSASQQPRSIAEEDIQSMKDAGPTNGDVSRSNGRSSGLLKRAREDTDDEDEAQDHDASQAGEDEDNPASSATPNTPHPLKMIKGTMAKQYSGIVKAITRVPQGLHQNGEGKAAPRPMRIGRMAVNAFHQQKTEATPASVCRPSTAPKFQQRIRDPLWEMEMDRGRVKKVKSKVLNEDASNGSGHHSNPFQDASQNRFDYRGRPRRNFDV